MDVLAYISSLSATDKLLLKRKLMGITKCPKKVVVRSGDQTPEELRLKEWESKQTPELLTKIAEFVELQTAAKTARFRVGMKGR